MPDTARHDPPKEPHLNATEWHARCPVRAVDRKPGCEGSAGRGCPATGRGALVHLGSAFYLSIMPLMSDVNPNEIRSKPAGLAVPPMNCSISSTWINRPAPA